MASDIVLIIVIKTFCN